jgi:hypothetical protein
MIKRTTVFFLASISLLTITQLACNEENSVRKQISKLFRYDDFVKDVKASNTTTVSDSANLFDKNEFDTFKDPIGDLLKDVNQQLQIDSASIVRLGINDSGILNQTTVLDLSSDSSVSKDTFTSDLRKIQSEEIKALKFNLSQLKPKDSVSQASSNCKQKLCKVWAHIQKDKQLLYLYVDGSLVDSFKVSTGDTKHETPKLDLRPSGPMFKKYTSKKFPGGNYQGLGNMPYAVFLKGGFAIHGTTTGNIAILGKKASHGCIRLHPENGKLFFELVKQVGIENTWVTISE